MAFNAQNFRASFEKPAQSNYFELTISRSPSFISEIESKSALRNPNTPLVNEMLSKIAFRCRATELPSKQLETIERRYHGPQRLVPYGSIFSTLNLEFIEDDKYSVRNFFDTWQDFAFGGDKYRPAYYDQIIADMTLTVFNASGVAVREYVFKDAYPISVNPSQMTWDTNNNILFVPIEITYFEFVSKSLEGSSAAKPTFGANVGFANPLDKITSFTTGLFNSGVNSLKSAIGSFRLKF